MEICFTENALLVRCKSWSTHLKGYSEKRSGIAQRAEPGGKL